ncbi:MAG TPA: molybdopterin-dependent oxidoreductase [Acidimicrobiales bacterium]|nr:molybdopterin-dependent oxidoreductase [Acidimicrobiales bacterium]
MAGPDATREAPIGRRVFLGMVGLGGVGVLFGARIQDRLERVVQGVAGRLGLESLAPSGRFRIYTVTGSLPQRSEAEYRLWVGGHVDRQLELTAADLKSLPVTRLTRDFQCVTGWRVRDVKWKGVRLAELLDRAGVRVGAGGVRFYSFDGRYTESLTLDQARREDVIVAWEMLGRPITTAHGGPVRLYVAPMYGYKSCKWLERVEVTEGPPAPGFWEERGYDVDAWIGRSNGRDDPPV